MAIFDVFISASQNAGIFSMYLPFILTFAVIYGLLNKSKILGEGRPGHALNAIVGFAVAFYVIAFTSAGVTIATFFSTFFTQTTALIVTMIASVLVLTALGPYAYGKNKEGKLEAITFGKYGVLIIVLILLWSFSSSGGTTIFGINVSGVGGGGLFGLSNQDVIILIFILVTVGIIYFVTSEPKTPEQTQQQEQGGRQRS